MPATRSVKLSDVRSILRLGEEVRGAADTLNRKRRLLLGLCRLVRGRMGTCVVTHLDRRSRRRTVVSVVSASIEDHDAPPSQASHGFSEPPLDDDPPNTNLEYPVVVDGDPPLGPAVECRLRRVRRNCQNACIQSSVEVGQSGIAATVRICCDRTRFTARERCMVDLVHTEMGWIYRADLPLTSPEALSLSPRQRQTLELLLAGDGEKQIASKLHLSPNTVHHYVKALHRHFGVSSRSELLARWVGK